MTVTVPEGELALTFTNETGILLQFERLEVAVAEGNRIMKALFDERVTIHALCNSVSFNRADLISVLIIDCNKHRELARIVSVQQAMDQVRVQREVNEALRHLPPSQTN